MWMSDFHTLSAYNRVRDLTRANVPRRSIRNVSRGDFVGLM